MNQFKKARFWVTQKGWAAVFAGTDIYRLPAGEVITDDLYIAASEIYIDGTVEGDLIAGGRTIVTMARSRAIRCWEARASARSWSPRATPSA